MCVCGGGGVRVCGCVRGWSGAGRVCVYVWGRSQLKSG